MPEAEAARTVAWHLRPGRRPPEAVTAHRSALMALAAAPLARVAAERAATLPMALPPHLLNCPQTRMGERAAAGRRLWKLPTAGPARMAPLGLPGAHALRRSRGTPRSRRRLIPAPRWRIPVIGITTWDGPCLSRYEQSAAVHTRTGRPSRPPARPPVSWGLRLVLRIRRGSHRLHSRPLGVVEHPAQRSHVGSAVRLPGRSAVRAADTGAAAPSGSGLGPSPRSGAGVHHAHPVGGHDCLPATPARWSALDGCAIGDRGRHRGTGGRARHGPLIRERRLCRTGSATDRGAPVSAWW
ncbi:hypothetical protein ABH930_004567 [Kitasatospora sp. GAS204A]|nr:hypothetical protein [Kitasatospora sp. GAS204B]